MIINHKLGLLSADKITIHVWLNLQKYFPNVSLHHNLYQTQYVAAVLGMSPLNSSHESLMPNLELDRVISTRESASVTHDSSSRVMKFKSKLFI